MFKIDDKYYELVLEDEDIAVLQNVSTGEPLTMPIRELWNYAIWRRFINVRKTSWKQNKKMVGTK